MLPERAVQADTLDEIDHIKLLDLLGDAIPNGMGVPISLVEAPNSGTGAYFPDETNPEFTAGTDPLGEDVTFIDGSGGKNKGVSAHANVTVGNRFFGNQLSMASAANEVTVYEAGDWMANILHTANHRNPQLPSAADYRVQNFSWISTDNFGSKEAEHRDVLQRFDYLINTYNMTALVGMSNNPNGNLPHLLGHSYNAIAVGRSDGLHSAGLTQNFYGPGRSKPDLVVPESTTSAAVSVLSSAAAMLHEVVAGTAGANSEVIKAILLAGATKDEFADWNRTTTQPLDDTYGVGELNVFNSWLIAYRGQTVGSQTEPDLNIRPDGWDFQSVDSTSEWYYTFEVTPTITVSQLSVVLAWNANVIDVESGSQFTGEESLANLNLALYDSSTEFLGTLVDQSVSTVDNVEHIYQTDLGPGTYTLKVSQLTADFDADGVVDGDDFIVWQRGFGLLEGALYSDGDANGDGAVDGADLAIWQQGFGSVLQPQDFGLAWRVVRMLTEAPSAAPLFAAVPEPSTLLLASLMAIFCWAMNGYRVRSS